MEKPNSSKPKLALIADDPWLEPYETDIENRLEIFKQALADIEKAAGSLENFASASQTLGINWDEEKQGWWYREWAPSAHALSLIGDFNQWDRQANPLSKNESGIWEVFVEGDKLSHGDLVKVHIVADNGANDRIPAYITRAVQDEKTHDFSGQVWHPSEPFKWEDQDFSPQSINAPLIYECHTGMAQQKEGVGTYREFAENVLPRIDHLGYNCIQLMAVQEHPYYGSFGYHVSNFFAPTSRFGTPEDLKYLVNEAHKRGVAVIMDVVHSHAVKNFAEGLNEFDGSDDHYFHPGGRGYHTGWDSKLFNYGKWEVKQFLLSNIKWWLEEFHFDGFRFDGVTSMLYFHHGDHVSFDHYDKYFKDGVEWDAITYLQLANELAHRVKPGAITIAEDMSGMPSLARPIEEGGLGFDYRLMMGVPDHWIKLLKDQRDEDWQMGELVGTLTNRRRNEAHVAYCESHDQALVGDKTIAFRLMDAQMYVDMEIGRPNPVIDRGIALHKMIRLITFAMAGEAWLNFMGNEFGHPDWVDFPRE
ncbi:MAG: 1,4-alpha-glucan-branching enzyme, partial [Bacteroidetes bacterium]|nr:1,4-alpha-glucan-branching enzyme [Bacteroidota bacterium]